MIHIIDVNTSNKSCYPGDVICYFMGEDEKLYRTNKASESVWLMKPSSYDGNYCWHWTGDLTTKGMSDFIKSLTKLSREEAEKLIIKLDMMNELTK